MSWVSLPAYLISLSDVVFLVFGAPTLNPNGTINVAEGTSGSLSCSRSPDTNTGITARWTFGSTQLASSTDSAIYQYTNIMRNESGDYNCTLTHNIGMLAVTRHGTVTINVQCESFNVANTDWCTNHDSVSPSQILQRSLWTLLQ